jgi:NTP pyrophosphatase (non-canonical NTP hydrolase)
MDQLIHKIRHANPKRRIKQIERRLLKLGEELGEVNQAYISSTSKNNRKNKTWKDVREELCDVIIIAMDILLTEMPDENYNHFSDEEKEKSIDQRILNEIDRKLTKRLISNDICATNEATMPLDMDIDNVV